MKTKLESDTNQLKTSSPPTPNIRPNHQLPTIAEEFDLIADTGTTANFVSVSFPVTNKRPALHPIAIRNPNGDVMYSTHANNQSHGSSHPR